MEPHNIDAHFRKTVDESAGYYEIEADQSKNRIWQQIHPGNKKQAPFLLYRLLIAACILLLFCSGTLAILLFREKNSVRFLAESNRSIKTETLHHQIAKPAEKPSSATSQTVKTDTVYIQRNVIVYKQKNTVEKQVDTVFIHQTIYTEREPVTELITVMQNPVKNEPPQSYQIQNTNREIVISNKQGRKEKKKGKLLFKLGGNNSPEGNGSTAFTVNL
ncbi:MAG: hypothetical protein IPH84_17600 [Bacteroidales bacterium]|nr:hypothetical protein [Bacteroidales bacterium]